MCGIIGYVGSRQAWPLVVEGLRRLEYRGYDSTGLVILNPSNTLEFHHSVGKVGDLLSSVKKSPTGTLGLGHNRWATHGRPTLANAHPHTDCHRQVAVVHNGIVENYLDLKRDLETHGHTFSSETDSEVIAHLIEDGLAREEGFEAAFANAGSLLKGANAVVGLWLGEPGKILGLRQGNAGGIAVAHKDQETILASDLPALLSFSNTVTFLEDGEMVAATADEVRYLGLKGKVLSKAPYTIPHEQAAVDKEGYRHFMLKEIMEQPQAITSALRGQADFQQGAVTLEDFPLSIDEVRKLRRVVLIGCGTSLHAAMVGQRLIEQLSGIPAQAESSSEFRYRNPVLDKNTLVVSVGQSGETADTLAAMEQAARHGARVITICNVEGSQATRLAEGALMMRSGLEIGVASTKTFISSLTLLALLALHLGQTNGSLSEDTRRDLVSQLGQLPNHIGKALSDHEPYKDLARWIHRYDHLLYLGRGITLPIALEGALKLKEISYIHAEGYAGGEMKHGPIALIDDGMATLALAPRSDLYEKILNNIKQIKARDGVVVAVGTEGDLDLASQVDRVLYIPQVHEVLIPFVTVVPLQLLAYYTAVQRGCDVDQPRNLAKSVTVE